MNIYYNKISKCHINSILNSEESYKYNTAGRLVEYSKENIEDICSSFNQNFPSDISFTPDKWTWGYKYNHAGVREQKRSFSICEGELIGIYK